MKGFSIGLRWVAAATCGTMLLCGCSHETKQRWLRVFFTGVDKPNPAAGAQSASGGSTNSAAVQAALLAPQPPAFIHKPYAERDCAACHLAGQAQELRPGGGKICLECHNKLLGTAKYVHAPVEDKNCVACHAPHQSAERFLLTRKGKDVCLDCHEAADLAKVKEHESAGTAGCVDCHDPHRSDLPKLAKVAK